MPDFYTIIEVERSTKTKRELDIEPDFMVNMRTEDLMVQGGDFYAVYNPKTGMWSTDLQTVIDIVDEDLKAYYDNLKKSGKADEYDKIHVKYMRRAKTGTIDAFNKLVQKQMHDVYHQLDETVTFADTPVTKKDYVSKRLPYAMEPGSMEAYEELISTLYDPEERAKLEWSIGAIIAGDSKYIQKFVVLYGDRGTGKSTFLDIVGWLFKGYVSTFTAKNLGSANASFALESFKDNPLVAIQHDGDLSKIEDNTRLNSLVSHELMEVNAKYTKLFKNKFNTFLYMGTNKPVKITDAKSGILRRLIDVYPSGRKLPYKKYHQLRSQVQFELGAIAYHCLQVYQEMGDDYYEDYVPIKMMAATNDFFDFIDYNYERFTKKPWITLSDAWQQYQEYCEFANSFKMPYRIFRTELMNYFKTFEERKIVDGRRLRNVYSEFREEKVRGKQVEDKKEEEESWLEFKWDKSTFDEAFADWTAQYAKEDGSPKTGWSYVKTTLADIDPHKLHWVKPGDKTFICADFDIRNEKGEKDFNLNVKEASKWPKTYAELSKSGGGIHLYYFYDGDPKELSSVFKEHVEIKTFPGNASLRRLLTKCNDLPIATIKKGYLPLKGDKKVVKDWEGIKSEEMLRTMILKNLRKEYFKDTSSSINYIRDLLNQAYESGLAYDVSDMQHSVLLFAMNSTNQSDRCVKVVGEMKFKSEDDVDIPVKIDKYDTDGPLTFFDIEIFPPDEETDNEGLFLIVYKEEGPDKPFHHLLNAEPEDVLAFIQSCQLVGFNNRKYDNHMCYARGVCRYSNRRLYNLSNDMIDHHKGYFKQAYNISKTDVLDFSTEKMGLKKWEIKLSIPHKECGLRWDQPAPKDKWAEIIKYCENDVAATEAVFNYRREDYMARKIQVMIARILHGDAINVCENDTTNTLSKRIIFGNNQHPQNEFNYRDLSKPVGSDQYEAYLEKFGSDYPFRVFNEKGLPQYRNYIPGEVLPEGWSILPFWPEYEFVDGKSVYLGVNIGEGGRVMSIPGMYTWVWDGDVSSMHPSSVIWEVLFGPRYTKIFREIVQARVAVKHRDFETAGKLLGGALKPYLNEENASGLAQALKIVINSIYGLTKAGFDNEFRDKRNVDNIVAKRGGLFMEMLRREVEKLGYSVCHIKTDSIKIPDATKEIQDFVIKFGREFGYEFETEGVFTKFCLLNDAAYIAKCEDGSWITKAAQFKKEKSSYTYKRLFSKEPIVFEDMCEVVNVNKGALYLDMNEQCEDVTELEKDLDKLIKKHKKAGTDYDKDPYVIQLRDDIKKGHNYIFVGRVGQFTPIKKGAGGGVLCCIDDDGRVTSPGGTVGYRWLESEDIKQFGLDNPIDESYYIHKVDEAIADINSLDPSGLRGFDWLVADDDFMNPPEIEGDFPWPEK